MSGQPVKAAKFYAEIASSVSADRVRTHYLPDITKMSAVDIHCHIVRMMTEVIWQVVRGPILTMSSVNNEPLSSDKLDIKTDKLRKYYGLLLLIFNFD